MMGDSDFCNKEAYKILAKNLEPLSRWYKIHCPMKRAIKKALLAGYEIEFNPNGTAYKVKDGRMTKITGGEDGN